MCRACRIGNGRARVNTGARKPRDQIREHCLLAGKKVAASGRVDPDSIKFIGRDQRAEARHDPASEPVKRFPILVRFGFGER